jgi:hypothetical protein
MALKRATFFGTDAVVAAVASRVLPAKDLSDQVEARWDESLPGELQFSQEIFHQTPARDAGL